MPALPNYSIGLLDGESGANEDARLALAISFSTAGLPENRCFPKTRAQMRSEHTYIPDNLALG